MGSTDLRGPPSISPATIQRVLAQGGSPAASEPGFAQCLYDAGKQSGIDPAFPLAFFKRESSFGRAGIAKSTKGIGNVKGSGSAGSYKGFRAYSTWCQGAKDWFGLISGSKYYFGGSHFTLEQILPIYAPTSDNNVLYGNGGYINGVAGLVSSWRNSERYA